MVASIVEEIKQYLSEAADSISAALSESYDLDIHQLFEALSILKEVLNEACPNFYVLCSSRDCSGCFLSQDVVPAFVGLIRRAIQTLSVAHPIA